MSTATTFNPRELRKAFGHFASGVTVVTTNHDGSTHGMTANAFVSVSLEPPLVLVSVDHRSHMHKILPVAGRYGISVLSADQELVSDHFAGRPVQGADIQFVEHLGVPLLAGALAYFVVEIVDMHPAGDHTLYIARVEHFEAHSGAPLLFYSGKYEQVQNRIECSAVMDKKKDQATAAQ